MVSYWLILSLSYTRARHIHILCTFLCNTYVPCICLYVHHLVSSISQIIRCEIPRDYSQQFQKLNSRPIFSWYLEFNFNAKKKLCDVGLEVNPLGAQISGGITREMGTVIYFFLYKGQSVECRTVGNTFVLASRHLLTNPVKCKIYLPTWILTSPGTELRNSNPFKNSNWCTPWE